MLKIEVLLLISLSLVAGCVQQPSQQSNVRSALFTPGENMANVQQERQQSIMKLQDGAVVELEAVVIEKTIDGEKVRMYGYNGQSPGPTLKVKQGSKIIVKFKNSVDLETTVHWHGLRHANKDDGVPDVTQAAIKPDETFAYELYFPDPGMYWYHPHIRDDIQQESGLYGVIIVEPAQSDYFSPVDKEELLVLDDILLRNGQLYPFNRDFTNFALMGRFGDKMLVNGRTDYTLSANSGNVVRFYIVNTANARPFNVSFSDARMKIIGSDLGAFEHEYFAESMVVGPAERYIVDVLFDKPGEYGIMNINPTKTYKMGSVKVGEPSASASSDFNAARTNAYVVADIDKFRPYFDKVPDHELLLTVDMPRMPCHRMPDGSLMGDCSGSVFEPIEFEDQMGQMNAMMTSNSVKWIIRDKATGKENMNIMYQHEVGDVVKMRLVNDPKSAHPMQHPVHLHGQRFLVLSTNGENNDNLAWKDTVLVPAGSTVDILVDASNPGEWMLHCHIVEHLHSGMMASFEVA